MASVFYLEDLSCCICLTIFTDPVTLHCGHSFCRTCIIDVLNTRPQCPQCQTETSVLTESLQTNHILKSLAEKAKEAEKMEKEHRSERAEVAEWLCPEHDEKLKLFCVTDQQLTCIICRDGERHEGHKFKPVKEAAASLRQEMENGIEKLSSNIHAIESQANSQREEITKTKKKSYQLMTQICSQFEEMHQLLRKREDEIKKELKHKEEDAVEKMSKRLNAIETALSESRELEGKVTSVLNITDPERFLKSWTEDNSTTPEDLFRPRADDLQVVNTSLSLGPYESHLQFFMWKEMLQVIQPREEMLSLKSNSATITVSDDGRSLLCTTNQQTNQAQSHLSFPVSKTFSFRPASPLSPPPASTIFHPVLPLSPPPASTIFHPVLPLSPPPAITICHPVLPLSPPTASTLFRPVSPLSPPPASTLFRPASPLSPPKASTIFHPVSPLRPPPASTICHPVLPLSPPTASTLFRPASPLSPPPASTFFRPVIPLSPPPASTIFRPASPLSPPTAFAVAHSTSTLGQPTASTLVHSTGVFGGSGTHTSPGQHLKKSPLSTDHVISVNEFTSGQHYWEVEVGQRNYWELGVKDYFLKYDGQKYTTCSPNIITELTFGGRPRKIGIYLNCPSKKVSFYDADNMSHIHTMSSGLMSTPVLAYFKVAADPNRLTACCY